MAYGGLQRIVTLQHGARLKLNAQPACVSSHPARFRRCISVAFKIGVEIKFNAAIQVKAEPGLQRSDTLLSGPKNIGVTLRISREQRGTFAAFVLPSDSRTENR